MGYRRQDWPLTNEQLEHVISLGETRLVEFKRDSATNPMPCDIIVTVPVSVPRGAVGSRPHESADNAKAAVARMMRRDETGRTMGRERHWGVLGTTVQRRGVGLRN